jgi:threonine synthase
MNNDFNIVVFRDSFIFFGLKYNESSLICKNQNGKKFYIKNDFEFIYNCSKTRSLVPLIKYYLEKGISKFSVSSSGNSAVVMINLANISEKIEKLYVFLSNHISQQKISFMNQRTNLSLSLSKNSIQDLGKVVVEFCDNPKQKSFQLSRDGYLNIRGSVDENAKWGFKSISKEISLKLPNIKRIFVPSSSGTTAAGIYEGFREVDLYPEIHIVQTSKVHTLANHKSIAEPTHPAESIVDLVGFRKNEIRKIVKETNGMFWIINSAETIESYNELKSQDIKTSYDSSLGYAALKKFILENPAAEYDDNVVLFTG